MISGWKWNTNKKEQKRSMMVALFTLLAAILALHLAAAGREEAPSGNFG
jgi:hypothetical protein